METNNNKGTYNGKLFFGAVLNFAMRYALGRMSTAPSIVQDFILDNLEELSDTDLEYMIRDIDEHEKFGHSFGMEMDKEGWDRFKALLKAELISRKEVPK